MMFVALAGVLTACGAARGTTVGLAAAPRSGIARLANVTPEAASAVVLISTSGTATAPAVRLDPPRPAAGTVTSASFVDAAHGWVITTDESSPDLAHWLWATADGGQTWNPVRSALTAVTTETDPVVRFADVDDGWIVGDALWATHDGGASWHEVPLPAPFAQGDVLGLSAGAGAVHVAVIEQSGNGADQHILVAPAGSDALQVSPVVIPHGAAPVADFEFAFAGARGWLIYNERIAAAGAQLAKGSWVDWSQPCPATGPGFVAAAPDASLVVALCSEGVWAGPQLVVVLQVSTDGGATFHAAAAAPPATVGSLAAVVAAPDTNTIVAAYTPQNGTTRVERSTDRGQHWTRVAAALPSDTSWSQLTFASPTVGFAVTSLGLLVTHDGGVTFTPATVS